MLEFIKLTPTAKIPAYAFFGDAGFDFFADETVTLQPGETKAISTGVVSLIQESDLEIQIRSRSGLALKHQVIVLNAPGTIDSGYRGEIKIILTNFGKQDYVVNQGDRIAQGVLNTVINNIALKEVKADFLNTTSRGAQGFGSTGVSSKGIIPSPDSKIVFGEELDD